MMRLALIFLMALTSATAAQTTSEASITGVTRDCFSFQEIHPAGVDVYLVNRKTYPHISQIVQAMQNQMTQGAKARLSFWNSFSDLLREVRTTKTVPRTTSSKDGSFVFRHLRAGQEVMVLGLAEREDDPMYYALIEITLTRGVNSVVLDFYAEQPCNPGSRQ